MSLEKGNSLHFRTKGEREDKKLSKIHSLRVCKYLDVAFTNVNLLVI